MRTIICCCIVVALLAEAASADELRNVKVGEPIPAFTLNTLDGATLDQTALNGKVTVLVFLSAEQRSSENAMEAAHETVRQLVRDDLSLLFATADTARVHYFRGRRDRSGAREPFGLDFNRDLYGKLGLIVLPTTIVVDRDGRLAHVISSYKSDYPDVLGAYIRHTLGEIDDEGLEEALTLRSMEHGRLEDRVARHRAAARVLRETHLPEDAARELRTALELDPDNTDVKLDLASLHLASKELVEARSLIESVVDAVPHQRRAKLLLGALLYHEGRLDEARSLLERVLLLNPDPVFTHYYLGLIAERQGDAAKAAEHFEEALQRLLEDRVM